MDSVESAFASMHEMEAEVLLAVMKGSVKQRTSMLNNLYTTQVKYPDRTVEKFVSGNERKGADFLKDMPFYDMIRDKVVQVLGPANHIHIAYRFDRDISNRASDAYVWLSGEELLMLKKVSSNILFLNVGISMGENVYNCKYYRAILLFTEKEVEDRLECFQGKRWIKTGVEVIARANNVGYKFYSLLIAHNTYKQIIRNWWLNKLIEV